MRSGKSPPPTETVPGARRSTRTVRVDDGACRKPASACFCMSSMRSSATLQRQATQASATTSTRTRRPTAIASR